MEINAIAGLTVQKRFLNVERQKYLIEAIDSGTWNGDLKRRVQHFGYRYDYSARRIAASLKALPIPEWGQQLMQKILQAGITNQAFDQLIVNEYLPGQGISPHIDSISSFGNDIVSVSLGSPCVMRFACTTRADHFNVLLEPGDLLHIRDEARYQWRHQIEPRRSDKWAGQMIERARRVSATFRRVLLP
jgi:alkylated DNA repair dioxygenase AlkB